MSAPAALLEDFERLDTGWRLCLTQQDEFVSPPAHAALEWIEAQVPGTAAAALEKAGRFDRGSPIVLDAFDVWYCAPFSCSEPSTLKFDGLATIAEVWLDQTLLLRSENMFLSHKVEIAALSGTLWLCFRSLDAAFVKPVKRARWRPRMITPSSLNHIRTTLLGHMPGWCPAISPVGPWRAIKLDRNAAVQQIKIVQIIASYDGSNSMLHCSIELPMNVDLDGLELHCAGHSTAMQDTGAAGQTKRRLTATLEMHGVQTWWPHTHGEPTLHDVEIRSGEKSWRIGRVGFRSIVIDHGSDGAGFTLLCNGVPVFCRGACWTPVDLVSLPSSRADYEPRLRLAKEAGMNMLRVGGTMVYESKAFYDLCDELGILVWQDFMFANFDYPAADEAFMASVRQEASQFLALTHTNASLAVLCGGSEVYQQAAMLGLTENAWLNPIFTQLLPKLCTEKRPDVHYVENSPYGGSLPFFSDHGVAHYYGVGAYMRPLEDARRANVRFASECLAFANIPEDPRHWKDGVPQDIGAEWDFADVRDHYLKLVYDCDPEALLAADEERYLELCRASTAHVFTQTFAEWRRAGSSNGGALIWFLADIARGSGWGVIDAGGTPKSVWHALKQCLQPVQVLATDEGVNGLMIHIINETGSCRVFEVELRCLQDGRQRVVEGRKTVELAGHAQIAIPATDLFGAFFDTTHAFRFGPPSHDVVTIKLQEEGVAESLSRFDYFPFGLNRERHELGLAATLHHEERGWFLELATDRFAQFVQIIDRGYGPSDNWFHLAPGSPRRVALHARSSFAGAPCGRVRAVNGLELISYGDAVS